MKKIIKKVGTVVTILPILKTKSILIGKVCFSFRLHDTTVATLRTSLRRATTTRLDFSQTKQRLEKRKVSLVVDKK